MGKLKCFCFLGLIIINIVENATVTITDTYGTVTYQISSAQDSSTWYFSPIIPSTCILFVFQSLNIQSAQLQIYDSSSGASGKQLFTCASCGNLIPPPFYSSTNSVVISVRGVSGASFTASSFQLQYVSKLSKFVNNTSSYTSFSLTLNMPYAKIDPLLVRGFLPANSKMMWMINVNNVNQIIFSISKFYMGNTCSSELYIYNGWIESPSQLIYIGCKQSDTPTSWLYASSGQALIILKGGTYHQNISFIITYTSDSDMYNCGSLVQPDTMYDDSMIITDGSKSTNNMRRSTSCTWLISPLNKGPVTLLMKWVSIKDGGSIVVYDGSTTSSNAIIWNCIGPTTIVPPILTATTGILYIVYTSNTYLSIGYFGFEGQYFTRSSSSSGIGSRKEILTMSSTLSLTPPWYSYSKTTGNPTTSSFSSSSLPYVYTWYILPSATVSFLTLSLFQTSLLSRNSTSSTDQLTIYNGPSLSSPVVWQGSSPTSAHPNYWLSLSSKQAVVQLSTSSRPLTGFQLAYTTDGSNYHCGFSTNPGNLSSPSLTFSDGSGASSSIIANQYCVWQIEVEGSKGVYLYFKEFDIRGASLSIFQGNSITGTQIVKLADLVIIPPPLTLLTTSTITVMFASGSGLNGKTLGTGFTAVYYTITKETSFPGDGTVHLCSSSVASLTLPMRHSDTRRYNTEGNLTWILSPSSYNGSIYISFSWIYFPNCLQHYLLITNSYFNRKYCGGSSSSSSSSSSMSSWITVPYGLKTYIQYVTTGTSSNATSTNSSKISSELVEGFELSYYADGPNVRCGLEGNAAAATLTAPSMIVSDGSSSTSQMYPGQSCEWIISPFYNSTDTSSSADGDGDGDDSNCRGNFVFIEFLLSDLQGASLEVYDGANDLSDLLWNCSQCTTRPNLIIAMTGRVFIRYISQNVPTSRLGKGFRLVYWSTSPSYASLAHSLLLRNIVNSICNISTHQILELPNDYMLPSFVGETTPTASVHMNYSNLDAFKNVSGFILIAKTMKSSLTYMPYMTTSLSSLASSHSMNDLAVRDGRPLTASLFPSTPRSRSVCGVLHSDSRSTLTDPSFALQGSLSSLAYVLSSMTQKLLLTLNGSWDMPSIDSVGVKGSLLENISFSSAKTCVYFLKSSTPYRRIILNLNSYQGLAGGALRVYGGTNGENALLVHKRLGSLHSLRVELPCGLATLVVEPYNYSDVAAGSSGSSSAFPVYSLRFSYYEDPLDDGSACVAYVKSLTREAAATSMLLTYIIAIAVLLLSFLCLLFFMFYRQPLINKYKKWRRDLRYGAISPHPPYRPILDGLRNLFLFPGKCCICQDSSGPVIQLKCRHALCKVDMKGYVEAALQDISKFPVKCPMHFEGCECTIPPAIAKRFVTAPGYTRFLDFLDRSLLGEGMRCVFCNNFVNFPMDGKILMVDCPHCVRRFCMRCRQPWHYTTRCPFEAADDGELENWKQSSGAQKCPACAKLIEKDDPDTCNHMVHKITDSIPCVRNRTDFCYLCGLEVLADYPHEEVDCPGINHFPDGVFQDCRTVIKRLKEASRESDIKHARRNRKYKRTHANIVVPVFELDENRSEVSTPLSGSGSGTSSVASVKRSDVTPLPATAAAAASGVAWESARQSPPRDYQRPRRGGGGTIGFR